MALKRLLFVGYFLMLLLAACQNEPTAVVERVTVIDVTATPVLVTDIVYVTAVATATPEPAPPTTTQQSTALQPTPPSVIRLMSRAPMANALKEFQPTLELEFNGQVDPAALANALTIDPPLPFTVEVDNRMAFVQLEEPLVGDTTYAFTLAETAVGVHGTPLVRAYEWNYRLQPPIQNLNTPTLVDPNKPLRVDFYYAMNQAHANQAWRIEPEVAGQLVWSEDGKQLTFIPDEWFDFNHRYTIWFADVLQAADGTVLPEMSSRQFKVPSAILSYEPQEDYVDPERPIKIKFITEMNTAVTEAAFSIEPAVEGTFTWEGNELIFQPTAQALSEQTTYTVTLASTAVTSQGRPAFTEPHSWTFTTSKLRPTASFGSGPHIQLINSHGRRVIQYGVWQQQWPVLNFELYAVDLETDIIDKQYDLSEQIDLTDAPLLYSWQEEITSEDRRERELLLPEELPIGIYLLSMQGRFLNDQLLIVLTENNVIAKETNGELWAWVTNLANEPVPGAQIELYNLAGELMQQGQADENGFFYAQLPAGVVDETNQEPALLVARDGEDVTLTGLQAGWRYIGANNYDVLHPQSVGYVITDRPIYKPGQDVHFKALLRFDDDAVLTVPPVGTAVTAMLQDARGNVVQTVDLLTNDFGTVNGTFSLAEGAMLGDYRVTIQFNDRSYTQYFQVEDYRKPDYTVTITTPYDRYAVGQEIEVMVEAEYYFGEPVANAHVEVHMLDARRYSVDRTDLLLTGTTDANGRFTATVPLPKEGILENYNFYYIDFVRGALEATVDDGSHQTVSSSIPIAFYQASEKISVAGAYLQQLGTPFDLNLTVETIFSEPVHGRSVAVQLAKNNLTSSGYYGGEYTIVQTVQLTTDAQGQAVVQLQADETGYYRIRFSSADEAGNEMRYDLYIYVMGDSASWYGRANYNNQQLYLDTAQTSYLPGETAQLIIESTVDGRALLTVERGAVYRHQWVDITAPITLVDLPILATDAPNLFVRLAMWHPNNLELPDNVLYQNMANGRLLTASRAITVVANHKQLNVSITPDQTEYVAGQEATFTVQVTNYLGEPVSAELSLAMVDEAIFGLSPEQSPPIYDSFYYARSNNVTSSHSFVPTRWLYDEGGQGGGGGDDVGLVPPRTDFPDTAVWLPTLYTDHNGQLQVSVTLPDTITQWRLTAKATTADTQVGEAISHITTWQPLLLRPLLPRTLTSGDTAVLSTMVHNYSPEAQTVEVTLAVDPAYVTVGAPLSQTVTLAAGASQIVGWPLEAVAAGELNWRFTAVSQTNSSYRDAIELPLTIQPLAMPQTSTEVGEFSTNLQTAVQLPHNALPISTVDIQLSRSIAGTLLEGVDYLLGYPYGCVEQTMSKALPNAVVGRALSQLGVVDPVLEAKLPSYLNDSLQKLYALQHEDGGWGWWYDDQSDPYQTAWVLFGLAQISDAGYPVSIGVMNRSASWLENQLPDIDGRTQAFVLYAMAEAGYANEEATLALYELRDKLQGDVFSLASLALALTAVGEQGPAQQILDELAQTAVRQNGQTYWSGSNQDGTYGQKVMASDVRSTALALSAFSQIAPGHELENSIVRWLMGQRSYQGWGNTNETSFAILGLTDHLVAANFSETAVDIPYTVSVNGQLLLDGVLAAGDSSISLQLPYDQLAAGTNEIVISQMGSRPLFYSIHSQIYLSQNKVDAAGIITVERAYLDPETGDRLETVRAGQLVQVQLTVHMPQDGSYMMIEDTLPAGLEALNSELNSTSRTTNYWGTGETFTWQQLGYNYKEIRDNRVSFFVTQLGKTTNTPHTFTYMARATVPGTFTAVPVQVTAMYNLSLWGYSASDQLTVTAE